VVRFEITPKQQFSLKRQSGGSVTNYAEAPVQLQITPEAFANFSPGFERQREPWVNPTMN
jgi:hypothetical protein